MKLGDIKANQRIVVGAVEVEEKGKARMEAKIFGGGAVISGMNSLNVGERNTNFVIDFLKLHYLLSHRSEPYWRDQRDVASVPDSLGELMELWRHHVPGQSDLTQRDEISAQFFNRVSRSDLVVVAAGKKHLLGKEDFKKNAVVVDVGMHVPDTLIIGVDCDKPTTRFAHPSGHQ